MNKHLTPFDLHAIDEALYAINRAIEPDVEHPSDLQQKLIDARDLVWTVITSLDPTRRD